MSENLNSPGVVEQVAERPIDYLQLMNLTLREVDGESGLVDSNAAKREIFLRESPALSPDYAILAGLITQVPREVLEKMANPGPVDTIDPRATKVARYFLEHGPTQKSGELMWPLIKQTEAEIEAGEADPETVALRQEYIDQLTEEGMLESIRETDFLRMGIADRISTATLRELAETGDPIALYFLGKRVES